MPRVDCYCSRNWFRMYACRIEGERHTQFPYPCTMQDVLRARRIVDSVYVDDRIKEDVLDLITATLECRFAGVEEGD